jgi:hypothetical protein
MLRVHEGATEKQPAPNEIRAPVVRQPSARAEDRVASGDGGTEEIQEAEHSDLDPPCPPPSAGHRSDGRHRWLPRSLARGRNWSRELVMQDKGEGVFAEFRRPRLDLSGGDLLRA